MLLRKSRGQGALNLHFFAYSGDRAEGDPVGFGQGRLRQPGLQPLGEASCWKAVGKAVSATRRSTRQQLVDLRQRLAPHPRGRVGLSHSQLQIGAGDLDTCTKQDALTSALRRRRPDGFQDLLGFPEIAGVVERHAIAQRRVTGSVSLTLFKGNVNAASRRSPYSLYRAGLASFSMTGYNPKDAEGFINLFALPITVPLEAASR